MTLVDLGGGSGYWLPGYAAEAGTVIGVEPDPALLLGLRAVRRDRGWCHRSFRINEFAVGPGTGDVLC